VHRLLLVCDELFRTNIEKKRHNSKQEAQILTPLKNLNLSLRKITKQKPQKINIFSSVV